MVDEDAAKAKKLLSMEEAKANVSDDMKKRLGEIWDKGLLIANKTEAHLPGNNKGEEIGQPSLRLKRAINKVIGKVHGKKALSERLPNTTIQIMTIERTWHAKNRHGEGKEKRADQIPVTKETFMLIPDVLENFDSVEIARDTWERNRRKPSVIISRHYSDGTVILADAIIDENTLKIKTMWVEKTGCGKT